MTRDPVDQVLEWEGVSALAPVWSELARRMGASSRPVRRIQIRGLSDEGRRKLASLRGDSRLPTEEPIRIDVSWLAGALGLDDSQLESVVEQIAGPIHDRVAEREAEASARKDLWDRVEAKLSSRIPETLSRIRSAGVPGGDVFEHGRVLDSLAEVIDTLPLADPTPLPMLAWRLTGDPHGLDAPQSACGRYLLQAAPELAKRAGLAAGVRDERGAMRSLGVIPDRLSTTTVIWALRAQPGSIVGDFLEAGYRSGMPVNVSGAMLDRGDAQFTQSRWLCVENPSLIEIAAARGADRPIVCTSGWPAADTQRLLDLALEQGIELEYAGDYDPAGLAIANWMTDRFGASIRMSAVDYCTASHDRSPVWPDHAVPRTPWDDTLGEAIRRERRIVYQEDPHVWAGLIGAG